MGRKVRIGIDVGGTFTDAVVIDHETYEVLDKRKIPTTHAQGVAQGVVNIISSLMKENHIAPEDVAFIAHGTTQATNALLEGDVAPVGIVGMATGFDATSARKETNIGDIELAPNKFLHSKTVFVDSKQVSEQTIDEALKTLVQDGAQVIAASEAFSVDDPTNELFVMNRAQTKGLYSTGGHDISQLYGLKMRTRTAVVNASLIPKMMETANMTEQAVKDTGIQSPLMIMRCDGGVMNIDEVRKRPILTMLSGLAAGVAGALMYEKISDGIFFEAGGTSVDISVIKNGKVMIKYAQVGRHKTYLQSLDVRTMGIAGGSMIRVRDGKVVDVGPRSAHIANKEYECFAPKGTITSATIKLISPHSDDPSEYAIITAQNGHEYALTLAGAANLLGYVPEGDYAEGVYTSAETAWQALGESLGMDAKAVARQAMDIAMSKLEQLVDELIEDYTMDRNFLEFIGGGGSGAVVVNALAERMHCKARIAQNAPYISTIGVALAMVREQMERTVSNPTEQDIKQIRADVLERIVRSGANEGTVEISIEIDSQRNILRAIATGSTELRKKDMLSNELDPQQMLQIAAESIDVPADHVSCRASSGRWNIFVGEKETKSLFGLIKRKRQSIAVLDREGVARFRRENAKFLQFTKQQRDLFGGFLEENTLYSDANATIPKVFVFYREKMLDLTGMQTAEQLFSILDIETEMMKPEEVLLAVAYQ